MTRPLVVTGYINLNSAYRADDEYRRLGRLLKDAVPDVVSFEGQLVSECWLAAHLPESYTVAMADNPYKNTVEYHLVQHQKIDWMRQAMNMYPERSAYVWVDYAVFHVPGVTATVINDYLDRAVAETAIAIPGCWPPDRVGEPSWRFCGSVLLCAREHVMALDREIKQQALKTLAVNKRVTFEVNTWAAVEKKSQLPIRWYRADHDASLFTEYTP